MDAATLASAMGCSRAVADRYVAAFNAAMLQAGCTTVNRAAMWCAQLGHESAGLKFMREIWGPTAAQRRYEGRTDLGNTQPGDGKRFAGHGPIQITGRHNHTLVSRWAHSKGYVPTPDYFVDRPDELAGDQYGFLGAVWYWTVARPAINGMCDRGDLVGVTRAINGGTNGLTDRRTRWERGLRLGNALLPSSMATAVRQAASSIAPVPTRRPRGDSMYFETPEPQALEKWDWPTIRIPFAFDPIGGWGGKCILKVDHGGRGGWIHLARWWLRDAGWSANLPTHHWQDHPLGASRGHAGSERFVGFGWQTAPPVGADQIEIVTSAPDGVHVQMIYEK